MVVNMNNLEKNIQELINLSVDKNNTVHTVQLLKTAMIDLHNELTYSKDIIKSLRNQLDNTVNVLNTQNHDIELSEVIQETLQLDTPTVIENNKMFFVTINGVQRKYTKIIDIAQDIFKAVGYEQLRKDGHSYREATLFPEFKGPIPTIISDKSSNFEFFKKLETNSGRKQYKQIDDTEYYLAANISKPQLLPIVTKLNSTYGIVVDLPTNITNITNIETNDDDE